MRLSSEYVADYERLDKGLNLSDRDGGLVEAESPEMKNMFWYNGALCSRPGQHFLSDRSDLGPGRACYEGLFWGRAVFHIGEALLCAVPSETDFIFETLATGLPETRGTFFRYGDCLYYKAPGAYLEIGWDGSEGLFAREVPAYTPVTVINADPGSGAGDLYQPENRLSGEKTIRYTAGKDEVGEDICHYYLPVKGASVLSVAAVMNGDLLMMDLTPTTAELTADPEAWDPGWDGDFAFYPPTGHLLFRTGPFVSDPPTANTVQVTYFKENAEATQSVMDCACAAVYGGDQQVCVVMAGSEKQPNAYFWNGNHTVMDPGYFPMPHYNLAGDAAERITGFGRQQSLLVVFKEKSVGKASMAVTRVDGRDLISLPYTAINSAFGCDLPWSIRLIENNLVFASRQGGVFLVGDSSAAFENNILPLSAKVNRGKNGEGLLYRLGAASPDTVTSCDDGERYWIVGDGCAYVWDYRLSGAREPAWFFFTEIGAADLFLDGESLCHLDRLGRVSKFSRQFSDYGEPIEKVYRFPAARFGGADRLKEVTRAVLTVSGETPGTVELSYHTENGVRRDPVPIRTLRWTLCPRNLGERFLGVPEFAAPVLRRPGCRNVINFSMRLYNRQLGSDMSVISARIFYKLLGRYR